MRELAKARDFEVVSELQDNDISATKGLHRPGYEQVWDLVRAGAVDHLVVWQTSRFVRSRTERAQVIETFGRHAVDIIAVKGPSLDLRTAYGRGMADLMTAFDSLESEVKAERVSAAITDLTRRGKAWGFCPYGWDRTGKGVNAVQVENPHEADIVRELVDRLLAGESLNELYRDMNLRGEPSPGYAAWMKLPDAVREHRLSKGRKEPAKSWGKSTIRTIVARDANIGVRSRGSGTEVEGDWPAIIDPEKHAAVIALLKSPERRAHTGPRPGARKHLLTNGIGECGVCGEVLRVARRNGQRDPTIIYTCAGKRGCVGRTKDLVDDWVARVVVKRLALPDALDWLLGDDQEARQAAARVDELQRQLDDAADMFSDGTIVRRQLERITAKLTPELEAAVRARDTAVKTLDLEALRPLAGPEAATRWKSMPVSAQRRLLEAMGARVVILPRVKHGPGFEPETVAVQFGREDAVH